MIEKLISNKTAQINEETCIGCTLCIQACPVDAIMGAAKQMHTVIGSECIGCNLCTEPCPVDCITLIPNKNETDFNSADILAHANKRHQNQQKRLSRHATKQKNVIELRYQQSVSDRKIFILEAISRAQQKKN